MIAPREVLLINWVSLPDFGRVYSRGGNRKGNLLKEMSSGMVAPPFPSVFKQGRLRLNKKIPFLSGADAVVSNFKQNKEATRPFTNHPVCAFKDASSLLIDRAATPIKELRR
jgi:hypothetical protein